MSGKSRRYPTTATILLLFFVLSLLSLPSPAHAQRPCRDTVVHFSDSICEGETYSWKGREIDYSGVFYDTLRRANDTCDSVSILHLIVLPDIEFEIFHYSHCRGEVGFTLISSFRGVNQQWDIHPPDPSFYFRQAPNYAFANPTQPTTYTVHADYSSSPRCPDSASITISPIQPVNAGLTVTPSSIDYDHSTVTLHDASVGNREAPYGGIYGRKWFINGERIDSWSPDLSLDFSDPYPDTIHIKIIAYTPTCVDSATAEIPFNKDLIAIPNIFTPDEESNNRFLPLIQNVDTYHIYIYNRHGQLVFESTDPTLPWDGCLQGNRQPQGTYNYRIVYSFTYSPGEHHTLSGSVTLLR